MSGFWFDADAELQAHDAPMPQGWYRLRCSNSRLRKPNSDKGLFCDLTWRPVDPRHAARVLTSTYYIEGDRTKPMEEGRAALARVCIAATRPMLRDPTDLIGAEIEARLTISVGVNEIAEVRPAAAEQQAEAAAG